MSKSEDRANNPIRFFEDSRETHASLPKEIEAYREKLIAQEGRAVKWLDSMNERNPARIIGELVYARVQDYAHTRLGSMLLADAKRSKEEILKDDRASPPERKSKSHEWDRER